MVTSVKTAAPLKYSIAEGDVKTVDPSGAKGVESVAYDSPAMSSNPVERAVFAHTHFTTFLRGARRDASGRHLAMQRINVNHIRNYEQVALNTKKVMNFIIVDIDTKDLDEEKLKLLPPAWVVETPHGFHVGYEVDSVSRKSVRAMSYLEACRKVLTEWLGGDLNFKNHSTRNPFFLAASVRWGRAIVYKLRDLHEFFKEQKLWKLDFSGLAASKTSKNLSSRNCVAFDACLAEARRHPEKDVYEIVVAHDARHNASRPLPLSELRSITRSIERILRGHTSCSSDFRATLVEWGRRGGSSGSVAQKAQREKLVTKLQASKDSLKKRLLLLLGQHSMDDIADMLAISVSYAYRLEKELTNRTSIRARSSHLTYQVHLLSQEGLSKQEISLKLNVSLRTIYRHLLKRPCTPEQGQVANCPPSDVLTTDTPVLHSSMCHKGSESAEKPRKASVDVFEAMMINDLSEVPEGLRGAYSGPGGLFNRVREQLSKLRHSEVAF